MRKPIASIGRERELKQDPGIRARSRAMPNELLLPVAQLNLSVRAAGCLKKKGIHYLGDLVSLTESELLHVRNCGRGTITELNAMLSSLGLSLSMRIPAWERAEVAKLAKRHAAELSRIRQTWLRGRYGIDSGSGLEAEIASALAAVLDAKNVARAKSWIGLDQVARPTLKSVGDPLGLTRERIRQIVDKAKRGLAAVQFDMPLLHAAVDLMSRSPMPSEGSARTLLAATGLAPHELSTHALLRAAELFGVPVPSSVELARMAARTVKLDRVKRIRKTARAAIARLGCSTIGDICAQVNSGGKTTVTAETVQEILTAQVGFQWLDEESGWFWLERAPGRRNCLLDRINKVLAVVPRVDLAVLRASLARHFRTKGVVPPRRVLAALCRQLGDCRLVGGRTLVATRPRAPAAELSRAERVLVGAFRSHGSLLSNADALRRCNEAGVAKATANMALFYSPIVQRVAPGTYALVGTRATSNAIEAKAKTSISHRRSYQSASDYGWRLDASGLWVTYRITDSVRVRGTVQTPDAIRNCLHPRGYDLRALDGSRIGRIDTSEAYMSGFLPFFRQCGGEPGDHLRVTFDLVKRTALVELSEEAFDGGGSLQ
jgi:hypothetical protein